MTAACPVCSGEGRVLSKETIAIENLRTLRRHASLSSQEAFLVELDPEIAALMVGPGGSRLAELERSTGKHFSLVGVDNVPIERCSVTREGSAADILAEAIPVALGQEIELEIAEPHMFQAADAVAFLDGGYRIVVAGSGPYLGERHTVRIEHADRHEAIATLLTAKPVSEEEMLALIDRRTDIHEPERRLGERVDLEDRSRRRQRRPPAAAKKPGTGGGEGGSNDGGDRNKPRVAAAAATDGAEGGDAETRSSRNRRRRRRGSGTGIAAADNGVADGTVDVDIEDLDIDLELAAEVGADDDSDGVDASATAEDGTPAGPKKRRRGRRGGKHHRKPGAAVGAAGVEGGVVYAGDRTGDDADASVAVAEPAGPADAAAPAGDPAVNGPAPTPRRRRTRADIAAAAEAPAAEQAAPVEAAPAAATPRRTRRTKAEIAAAAEAAVAEPEPGSIPVLPDPEAKPKRRRGIIKRLISPDDE
jgi:hypothetical protein